MNLREALWTTPELFPLSIASDSSAVEFIRLAETDYSSASFLDHRLLHANVQRGLIPWAEVCEAARGLPHRCHFIFHISHVGSTLISRLLGLHPDIFSLREPGILRSFAKGRYADQLELFLGIWSRTFRPRQCAVIKATSFVSEMAVDLLDIVPHSRAILMYVPPETFLPALLDGALSDIKTEAAARLSRIQRRGYLSDTLLDGLSPGECVAMSWLAEMQSLAEVARRFPHRTLWIDFDEFLREPEIDLKKAFAHVGVTTEVAAYLSGPTMQRYAKRPEARYDSNFRQGLLTQARYKYSEEIARGLAWLDRKAIAPP